MSWSSDWAQIEAISARIDAMKLRPSTAHDNTVLLDQAIAEAEASRERLMCRMFDQLDRIYGRTNRTPRVA